MEMLLQENAPSVTPTVHHVPAPTQTNARSVDSTGTASLLSPTSAYSLTSALQERTLTHKTSSAQHAVLDVLPAAEPTLINARHV
jgi:hypothetical protein